MKTLKILIRIDLSLLALLGGFRAFAYSETVRGADGTVLYSSRNDLSLSFLGVGMVALAALLLGVSDSMLAGNRRWLGRWLAAANLGIAATAFIRGSGQYPTEWILLFLPLLMAILLIWAGTRPVDPAAELAEIRIPDEVRHALLRQVGESAAQEERNRLARDLHDSIKQQLFTINVGAATVQERWERDPGGARSALEDVRRSAREAMVEMQAMLHQLRPQALASTTGLVEALREQAEALGYRSGAQVTVEVGPEIPDDRMPPGAQGALFRIAQEALANVARHARAGTVRIWIGQEGEEAVLRVEDDGQGFDPEAAVSGMGLRNLRERAAALRGRVEIESEPGTGSTVRVEIPLPAPATPASETRDERETFIRSSQWLLIAISLAPVLQARTPDLPIPIEHIVLAFGFLACAIFFRIRGTNLWGRPESPRASLRFMTHRGAAVMFLSAAAQLSWSWLSSEGAWSEEELFFRAGALLCLLLFLIELRTLHRWSEPRRDWRGSLPSDHRAVFILGVLFFCAVFLNVLIKTIRDPDPARVVMVSLAVAASLYLVSRQPRFEGARP